MSKVLDHIHGLMAQELARGEGQYPLLDGEDELPNTAAPLSSAGLNDVLREAAARNPVMQRGGLYRRAGDFRAKQRRPLSRAGQSHAG